MLGRLFILVVLVIGGMFIFSSDIDTAEVWKKTQAFVLEKFGTDLEVQKELLLKKKEELAAKLQELQEKVETKTTEGIEKFEEIQESIARTQKAFEQTQASIEELESSLREGGEALGIIEKEEK